MTLLFVEDIKSVRDNYREFLLNFFSIIYETGSSHEAFTLYEKHSPDIILMDINIQGENGIQVIEKIRREDKKTKIIILSAHKNEEYLFSAIELGIIKYLVKPVKRSELKQALAKALPNITEEKEEEKEKIILRNSFIWYVSRKKLFYKNEEIFLTKNELQLFIIFCKRSQPYFSFEDAYFTIYNDYDDFNTNKIKMIIKRLRKKTSADILINIYGLGYKFNL